MDEILNTMTHKITTAQAAVLLTVLDKINAAQQKSPAMMAALDIDRHDLQKCQRLLSGLEKTNGK